MFFISTVSKSWTTLSLFYTSQEWVTSMDSPIHVTRFVKTLRRVRFRFSTLFISHILTSISIPRFNLTKITLVLETTSSCISPCRMLF
ncbi:MAG: hypothetical protein B7Z80_16900 [Rhodospirillales bacterium 20-64-7]|nr:MAG: hypothetical protein B7Z80_16900 [Rhodospirillales bacterium 20-64-7]